ncbi:MAG: transglycosylase SLT domain-containing protein [Longimicrobiales bacterium]
MKVDRTLVVTVRAWLARRVAEHVWPRYVSAVLVLIASVSVLAMSGPSGSAGTAPARANADVGALLERAESLQDGFGVVEEYVDWHVAPIERVLLDYRDDPALVRRIAVALVREANRTGLEPRLLLAVLLVENPWLDPEARSPVGAIGLMQVMPLHRGNWPQCAGGLRNIESNICHGAQIFASYYRAERNPDRALLRYNGCVRGTNTPNCHQYAYHVYARAGRASIMAWLRPRSGGAASP